MVQLKPHEFGEVLSKLEQFSLQKTCFEKLNLLSSLSILQAIQRGFFCPDYTNVVTLFMHEQQKKLDLSLATDC